MKCLVTGATGFIGGALCRLLAERGVELERTGREVPVDEQLQGTQVVFHAAGIAHRAASPQDYETFNYRATLDLAARAAASGVGRFVFLSSVNAGPAADPYGYWKWRTEETLCRVYEQTAMAVVTVRPALVYGPGAKANLKRLIAAVRRGMPAPPAGQPRSMIGLPDLCDALYLMLETDPGRGTVFYATDGESYDLRRIHRAFCQALGREAGRPWLPRWCWRFGCGLLDVKSGARVGETFRRLFEGAEFPNDALCETLAWRPRYALEDLAPAMVEAVE